MYLLCFIKVLQHAEALQQNKGLISGCRALLAVQRHCAEDKEHHEVEAA
jgi:hypothetical protein